MEETLSMTQNAAEELTQERPIEIITAEICFYKAQAGAAILEIGNRLIEAKAQLEHGAWLPWLEEKVGFSERSAQRFMRLAKEYDKSDNLADLGASKALSLLALPASEREEFVAEKHEVNGEEKSVYEMTQKELEKAIKERDYWKKETEDARRDLDEQLEEQRTVYDTDMEAAKGKVAEAENRAEGYRVKLDKLKAEMEELKAAPATVAVEKVIDQEAIDAAAAEAKKKAEDALAAKIEKAKKAKASAEQAKAKAEQDLAALKISQEQAAAVVEREKESLAEQVQTLQKKLAVASSSEMTVFKLHFEAAQNSVAKMIECIERMSDGGDAEGAGKLKNATKAFMTAVMEGQKRKAVCWGAAKALARESCGHRVR